jgi:hypothetical protein
MAGLAMDHTRSATRSAKSILFEDHRVGVLQVRIKPQSQALQMPGDFQPVFLSAAPQKSILQQVSIALLPGAEPRWVCAQITPPSSLTYSVF